MAAVCSLVPDSHAPLFLRAFVPSSLRSFVPCVVLPEQKLAAATQLLESTHDLGRCRHVIALITDLNRAIADLP